MLTSLGQRFGKVYTLKIPGRNRIIVCLDPKDVEHVTKTNFDNYVRGAELNTIFQDFFGGGIFNADGHSWYTQRKVASNIFNVKNFREFFATTFQTEAILMLKILEQAAKDEQVIDLCDLFHRYTLDSFTQIAFGVKLNILQSYLDGDHRPVSFAAAFDFAQSVIDSRIFNPFYGLTERLSGAHGRYRQAIAEMDTFAYEVIQHRREDPKASERSDLLSLFMNAKADDTGRHYTDKELRDIVMNMVIAGRDTTAQALSWTFYELDCRPDVVEKMRNEAESVLGQHFKTTDPDTPSYDAIKEMVYGRAVFTEALRLHPSVSKQGKVALKDDVLPSGYSIKAGSMVAFASYAMGRSSELWGADALEFKPERFVNVAAPSPFKYFAFNAGPRLCLGQNMATIEAMTALTLILRDFDVQLAVPRSQIHYGNGLTLNLASGLPVRVHLRK